MKYQTPRIARILDILERSASFDRVVKNKIEGRATYDKLVVTSKQFYGYSYKMYGKTITRADVLLKGFLK